MNTGLVQAIKEQFKNKPTEELCSIWIANDRSKSSDEAFEAVRLILEERGQSVPTQNPAIRELPPKPYNWFAGPSIVLAIAGICTLGASEVQTALQSMIGGIFAIASLILGIVAVKKALVLRSGLGLAIAGLVLGLLLSIGLFRAIGHLSIQKKAANLVGCPAPTFVLKMSDGSKSPTTD